MSNPRKYLVDTSEKLAKAWDYIVDGDEPIGFDLETFGPTVRWGGKNRPDPYRHMVAGFSLSRGNFCIYVPVRHTTGENVTENAMGDILSAVIEQAEAGRTVWVHNLAFELNILINEGLWMEHRPTPAGFRCSQVATWLAYTKTGNDLKLKRIADWMLGMKDLPDWSKLSKGRQAHEMAPSEIWEYAALDAWLTATVGAKAWADLEKNQLVPHFLAMDMPLVEVTRGMARAGMARDRAKLEELRAEWTIIRDKAAAEFEELTRTEVTIPVMADVPTGEFYKSGPRAGQPKTRKEKVPTTIVRGASVSNDIEVSKWCYEYLGWWPRPDEWDRRKNAYVPVERNGHGVYPVGSEYVSKFTGLAGPAGKAALTRLRYQKVDKLLSTYLDVMINLPDQYGDDLLHPSLNLTGTTTQRFSGSGPNFQNIPARDEKGQQIRAALSAPRPGWVMVVRDYSQIEIRLQADLASDPLWMEGYQGEADWGVKYDLHQEMADELTRLLGEPIDRKVGKIVNLAVQYGVSAETLATHIGKPGIDRVKAGKIIDAFYQVHPRLIRYQDQAEAYAAKNGFIPTKDGFKRFGFKGQWLPARGTVGLRPGDKRAAGNTPVQGWSAGIMKAAMLDLWRRWVSAGVYGTRVLLLNSVHDEIVVGCERGYSAQVAADMDELMLKPRWGIKVPLAVEGGIGDNWMEAK